jgi:hypothetical protein
MSYKKRSNWAVHGDTLKIWDGGDLVAEIPIREFSLLILELAKALKNEAM